MKNKILITGFLLFICACSCSTINEEIGESGYIIGIIVKLDDDSYGIEGKVVPIGQLFYSEKSVKYLLNEQSASVLLESHAVGDFVEYTFSYDQISNGDWNTVIGVYT